MTEMEKQKFESILVSLRQKFIQVYQNEIGIPAEDMAFYRELHQAIERGKKLHPGPYPLNEWIDAFKDEWREVIEEIYNITFRDENNLEAELIDLVVVACRIIQFLRQEADHKEAMKYDP